MTPADPPPEPAPPEVEAQTEVRSAKLALTELFLDPNNFRFRDESDYVPVAEESVTSPDVQRRTTRFILGDKEENVRDLIDSFKRNGWLPVDQIQVRKLARGKYLVVEGNRRVAALHYLERRRQEGAIDLGKLRPEVFSAIPVNLYPDADEKHHMVLAALKHISGNKKWPAINQARLLAHLRDEQGMSVEEVCQSVGISRNELTRSLRALALSDAYANSDYGDQFNTDKYNLFREVTSNPKLREWLAWDDNQRRATHNTNLEKLFSLLSHEEDGGADGEDSTAVIRREPAINTGGQVRELAKLVEDPKALARLEETRSLTEATLASDTVLADRVERSLDVIDGRVTDLFRLLPHFGEDDLKSAQAIIDKLQGLLTAKKRPPRVFGPGIERAPFNLDVREHFREVRINRFRGLLDVRLDRLRRINVFGGVNNSGKTSVLEAIYLLSQQADVEPLLEIVQRRGKVGRDVSPGWLLEQIPDGARLAGTFDTVEGNEAAVSVDVDRTGDTVENRSFYLGTIALTSKYGAREQWTRAQLYSERHDRRTEGSGDRVLCRAVLSSPFSMHDPEVLVRIHKRSVEAQSKDRIVEFLRESVDSGVLGIDLVDDQRRFLVRHRDFDRSPDLTVFGEGFQRVFHVALLFAYAENGIVLIDELDNAVHVGLLRPFVRLLHELSARFHAQVFVTTHSKECIEAWVSATDLAEDVTYFGVGLHDTSRVVRPIEGEKLSELMKIGDVDPRWVE